MNVLVLSPHADDTELLCGGYVAKLSEEGHQVTSVVFCETPERNKELDRASQILGIKRTLLLGYPLRHLNKRRQAILERLLYIRDKYKPDLVLQPCLHDIHQDHETVAKEGLRAFKNVNLVCYEALWNNLNFEAQLFVTLSREQLDKKKKAVSCYQSQKDKRYCTPEYVESLARVRGVQIGCEFAEAYSVIHEVR
jgi:N-acetylglucosamine malate deacetylase 1